MGPHQNRRASARTRAAVAVLAVLGATIALLSPASPAAAATPLATATDLAVDRAEALPGDPVTLTATVTVPGAPGTEPTGSVAFKRSTKTIGTAPIVNGTAVFTTTTLPIGTASLTATFVKTSTLVASVSPAREVVVAKGASSATVAVTSSALPGDTVHLSATASGPDADHPATGTITFKRGTSAIGTAPLVSGAASLSAALPAGTLAITATYNGSSSLNGSVSSASTITVAKAPTTTLLTVDAGTAGAPASLTATVAATGVERIPTGSVTFRRGTTSLGVVPIDLAGTARLTTALPAGPLAITATYGGSTSLAGSTSATTNLTIDKAATTTVLSLAPAGTVAAGDPVTLRASTTVADGRLATGTVTFRRGTTVIRVVPLVDGTATTSVTLPVGSLSITATYSGSPTLLASASSTSPLDVVKPMTLTTVSGPLTAVAGEPVPLTASVSVPGFDRIPTGTVTFRRGTTSLGSAPLDATGTAVLNPTTVPVGFHQITAYYNGSSTLTTSLSPAITTEVALAATTITVEPFTPPATAGTPTTLRATVAAVAPSVGTPNGRVTFVSGTTKLGQVTLAGGVATLTTTSLPAGALTVTASYGGSASYLPATGSATSALDAPTDVHADAGRQAALVWFAPPANDGGSPIVSYTVVATDQTDPGADPIETTGWWPPIEVTGLVPGHAYTFTVAAANEAGDTAESDASDPVVVRPPCPVVDGLSERAEAAPGVDWSGCDLTGADLSGLDLTGADLTNAVLRTANLTGADLSQVALSTTDLAGADLAGATIDGASFGTAMAGVRSGGLLGTPASVGSGWRVTQGYLVGPAADLHGADLAGADLVGMYLGAVDLSGADLEGADLSRIVAGFATFQGADLEGADLTGAVVIVSNLKGASFRGATLVGASLGASDLTGADLTEADLTGASFAGGCSPGGFPCFPNANLTDVIYCNTTMPDGTVDDRSCPA